MTLRIDPALPLLWRTPDDAQLGFEHPVVRLHALSTAQEHMLSALSSGTTRTALTIVARSHGADESEVETLLELVEPALARPSASPTVLVADAAGDRCGMAATMAQALADGGVRPLVEVDAHAGTGAVSARGAGVGTDVRAGDGSPAHGDPEPRLDAAVAISDFVLPPAWYGRWLRRDVPHLPIVFGATAVRIGPLVEPGIGPCLYCVDRYRSDADPAWPAFASQLWGRRSPARTTLAIAEATGIAVRMLQAGLLERSLPTAGHGARPLPASAAEGTATGAAEEGRLVELDTASGRLSELRMPRHPQCECATLAGTGSAIVTPIGAAPGSPTRAAMSAARA